MTPDNQKIYKAIFPERGHTTFTLRNRRTGNSVVYRVIKGPNYFSVYARRRRQYELLGLIRLGGWYDHSPKSQIRPTSRLAVAFRWFWDVLCSDFNFPPALQFIPGRPGAGRERKTERDDGLVVDGVDAYGSTG